MSWNISAFYNNKKRTCLTLTQVVFLSISHCSSRYSTKWNQHCYVKHFEFNICTTPPPPRKKIAKTVFHFSWVFQSMTVNVFEALYQTSQTIKWTLKNKLLGFRTRFLKAKLQSVLISFTLVHPCPLFRGNPMDLFFKISVLEANFCLVGDVEEIICSWKESVAGKNIIQGVWGDV